MEPFIKETYKGLVVLKAILIGLEVEILSEKYVFDSEVNKIGVKYIDENKKEKIAFPFIELNRFIAMCDQISEEEYNKIIMSMAFCDPLQTKQDKQDDKEDVSWN